MNKTKKSLKNF